VITIITYKLLVIINISMLYLLLIKQSSFVVNLCEINELLEKEVFKERLYC